MLVRCYGAYGTNLPVNFCAQSLELVKQGWVLAHAHIRGGQELGRRWYEQGRLLNKRNSIADLINVVDSLHQHGFSRPTMTAGTAWSAGAISLGAAVNERPELFRAVALRMPFLDVLTAMLDPSQPLTVQEYAEWGDPSTVEIRRYIESYDPILNLGKAQGRMPSMYITCSLADQRVNYSGLFKYVEKLRNLPPDSRPEQVIFDILEDKSHCGIEATELALENAFLQRMCIH